MRQARSSRARFDEVMLQRKRREAVLALGEAVYELAVSGELTILDEYPEILDLLTNLADIEDQLGIGPDVPEVVSSADWEPIHQRRPTRKKRHAKSQVWRPTDADVAEIDEQPAPGQNGPDDSKGPHQPDATGDAEHAGSGEKSPFSRQGTHGIEQAPREKKTPRKVPVRPSKKLVMGADGPKFSKQDNHSIADVHRRPASGRRFTETRDLAETDDSESPKSSSFAEPSDAAETTQARRQPGRRRNRRGGGGIAFVSDTNAESDDDLAQYMHEDDVPDDENSGNGSAPPSTSDDPSFKP